MKTVFLDIDGVLNCKRTYNPRKLPYVAEPALVARFKSLLDRTGAVAVLSSTWRYDPAGLFSARYWKIPFIDVTPDMPNQPRCDEVLAWLKDHPEVERFVIIDDEDDELDSLPLFQPSAKVGLSEEIARGAEDYLLAKTDKDMRRGRAQRLLQNVVSRLRMHPG
jgi:hypothetical protein